MARAPLAATDLLAAAVIALAAFAAAAALRHAGMLDRIDLAIDDSLMRAATDPPAGTGLFLILEREDDLARWGFPLPDDTLAALVEKVAQASPAAIAIDKYRDRPVPPGSERLRAAIAATDRLVWVAKFGADPAEAIDAPAAMDRRRVGCGDLVDDADGAVRRALLYVDQDDRLCYALAFQLARLAGAQRGYSASFTRQEPPALVIGKSRLQAIDPGDGPYARVDAAGFQVAFPAAAGSPAIDRAGLSDVLEGRVDPSRMRGRVVLFGSEAPSLRDFFNVPSGQALEGHRKIPGVEVHALIAAYLMAAAEGKAARVQLAPARATLLIAAVLALVAAVIACSRRRTGAVVGAVAVVFVLHAVAALALAAGGILFAPASPALAIAFAAAAGVARTAWLEGRERAQLMDIFSRHVSTEVADALWQNRAALIDRGVFVPRPLVATVLFLDIRGFTTVFEQLPAERAVPWLNRGLATMTDAIMRHEGVVARFIGDSIMAVFGAPVPRQSEAQVARDARSALDAALALQAALEALNHEFSAESLPQMRVRVGINTGSMTQCSVGTDRRMEFTLLGDAVNTASRLESYTMPDDGTVVRILAGERTIELAGAGFSARAVGSILLKGKEVPVTFFQVEGRS